jgi:hypothetical protein
MLLYAIPAAQLASATNLVEPVFVDDETQTQNLAQELVDETRQRIDQQAEQDQDQEIEQDIDQTNTANIDQSEVNNQANSITTGDNTATTTQVGDNDAIGNSLAAESEGGSAEAYKSDGSSASGGGSEASASIEQDVDNTATTTQDSSASGNLQVNTNTFGDDVAFVDQDNTADQTAVNVGVQTQEQDLNQYAINADVTANVGEQEQELCDPLDNIIAPFEPIVGDVC